MYIWLKLTSVTSTTQLTSWFPRTTAEPSTGYSRFSHSAAPAFAGEIAGENHLSLNLQNVLTGKTRSMSNTKKNR